MNTRRLFCIGLIALAAPLTLAAQTTVECRSKNYQYNECQAPLSAPTLIHQISSSSCILNRSWGFNPTTRRIWVADGCAGVFADLAGYHHGYGDTYDDGARHYNERGHDAGAVAAGMVLGALIGAAVSDSDKHHQHTTSNHRYDNTGSGYTGCHGAGCLVDDPDRSDGRDAIDTRPSFDRQGNPNFDTHGNWQGCHGVGCDVDPPDESRHR